MKRSFVHFFRFRSKFTLALFVLFAFMGGVGIVFAIPPEPIDDDPIGEVPFTPPADGFYWTVPSRFGTDSDNDGLIDFHWIQNGTYDPNGYYDPAYVHPNQYPVTFDGCQTESESLSGISTNTFRWRFLSPGEPNNAPGLVVQGNECRIVQPFTTQDTYQAQLTISQPDGTLVLDTLQQVVIRDYLIVSIGDSFASGEGNPDIPADLSFVPNPYPGYYVLNNQPRWQDARCGRSKWGGPAQAAMAIERFDPHTSVTFLSFACSGATIDTPSWEGNDINKYVGTGILGPYRGSEMPPNSSYNPTTFIPSQIDQVRAAVQNRPIDALIISGGGNDILFGTVAKECVLNANCWINVYAEEYPGSNLFRLDTLVDRAMNTLPGKFALLDAAIDTLNVANVYITQYPDLTRSDNINAPDNGPFEAGRYCSLVGDVLWPLEMSPAESKYASWFALDRLNQQVGAAAATHGWVFVDGIAEPFRTWEGKGHGYCASDAWIRTATESWLMQGPYWQTLYINPIILEKQATKGTLHPTARGHLVYAQRLQQEMWPRLNPAATNTPPPTFSAALTSGTSTSSQGQNGWLTGRCVGATCTSDKAVLRVDAAAQSPGVVLRGTKVTINGVDGCSGTPGISCTTVAGTGSLTFSWFFNISQTGIYHLQFQARDSNLQISTFAYEVKVDLNDPTASAMIPANTPSQAGWYTAPVPTSLFGDDPIGMSGVSTIRYNLDGTAGEFLSGSTLTINTDGAHTLLYQAVDLAGRLSAQQSLTINVDQTAPTSSAVSAPAANPAGWNKESAVNITLSTTDNGGSGIEAFTYSAAGAQTIAPTTVDGTLPVPLSISAEGETTISFFAEDVAGNVEAVQTLVVRIDRTAPTVTCGTADSQWHANNVSIPCSSSDNGSGLADAGEANFTLDTAVASGFEVADASTNSRQICDAAGNCVTAGPVSGNMVDRKAPDISISFPTGNYLLNEVVLAAYSCTDGGSGLADCAGPVSSGSAVDTASAGSKSFSVQAVDNVGNISTQASGYNVSYKLCVLFDQTKAYKRGSNVPIKLQLCDANNMNVSAPGIVLQTLVLTKVDSTASSEVLNTGNSNPDYEFRYDAGLGGYIYNLSTGNLSAGTWALKFTISGDPLIHTVVFDVR